MTFKFSSVTHVATELSVCDNPANKFHPIFDNANVLMLLLGPSDSVGLQLSHHRNQAFQIYSSLLFLSRDYMHIIEL